MRRADHRLTRPDRILLGERYEPVRERPVGVGIEADLEALTAEGPPPANRTFRYRQYRHEGQQGAR